MNFQVTVLKILVSYPDGFALMADLKRDMAILATSGSDWAERTRRLGSLVPDLDIFSQALIERMNGGWRITQKGRAALEFMEARPSRPEPQKIRPNTPAPRPRCRCSRAQVDAGGGSAAAPTTCEEAQTRPDPLARAAHSAGPQLQRIKAGQRPMPTLLAWSRSF